MRIAIVCYPTYGGSGVVATELGLGLAERGHEVHFVTYAPPFRMPGFHPNIHYHEVSTPDYPLFVWRPYDLALSSRLVDVALKHDLDLIHSHYAVPHAIGAFLAREMLATAGHDIRTVTTLHGTDITLVGNDPSYLHATRFGIQRSDAITAVSAWLVEKTREICGDCKTIDVIHNFVDLDRFNPGQATDEVRRTYAPDGERILVHISNLRPVKRVEDAVRAFARVASKMPAVLLIVGEGPEAGHAAQAASEAGVGDRVHFLGNQDGIEVLLASADIFLLPSEFESFGLAALEAMACGVPVVATSSGGIVEVVEDEISGRLVPRGDVDALAGACLDILSNEELQRQMGAAGRQRAAELFARDAILDQYVEVYERVLAGRADAAAGAPPGDS